MQLTSENYYSQEANQEYMSVSGYKDFAGTYGKMPCEFYGMEKLNGRWEDEKSTALLVGSYVDSYFEGSLEQFKKDNPEIFTQKGELKANFKQAEEIIARIERDEYFMKYMSGQKQVIMTGELFGAKWKIKMDSYIPGVAIVDLKVMASITDLKWVKDIGYLDFVRYWGYDIQGAVYQEIVRQNTGEKLPFFIAGATKQTEPDIRIIHVTDNARYYDNIVATMRKEHPRMKVESIRRKALDASQKYAEKQHRARAFTIAQTESAFAYNRGADEGIRQAQGEGYLGTMVKRWSTSGDDSVCDICNALEGTEVDMDSDFDFKGKVLFAGQHMLPPAHPRCACAIEYIEVAAPRGRK